MHKKSTAPILVKASTKGATTMIQHDPKAWEAGHKAGLAGKRGQAPRGVDASSYMSGLIEGLADRAKPPEQRKSNKGTPSEIA